MSNSQYRYQQNSVNTQTFIKTRRAPFGIVALILSIVSFILMMLVIIIEEAGVIVFGLYAGILGLVFSIIGLTIVKRNRQAYTLKPMLVVSLVLCIVSIIIGVLLIPQYCR